MINEILDIIRSNPVPVALMVVVIVGTVGWSVRGKSRK